MLPVGLPLVPSHAVWDPLSPPLVHRVTVSVALFSAVQATASPLKSFLEHAEEFHSQEYPSS